ncbi:hypothetical protein DW66_1761 [Pseudomonas putida]|nr:hypothetical protein DW66_1761 [Pseudomonas putida]
MAGHLEPPGRNRCPSLCQARLPGQRFRFYRADSWPRVVQYALCKMHDHAGCTKAPRRKIRNLLKLKDFFRKSFLARSLQRSTHVCHATARS